MILFQSISGLALSEKIRNISPISYEPIHLKNRTLNGECHIQTIGTPLKYIKFEPLSNQTQVDLINSLWSSGSKFRFIDGDKFYVGNIDNQAEWVRLTARYSNTLDRKYTAEIKLTILEEGTL